MSNIKNYNNFAKTFSKSRTNLKWEEINYFFDYINDIDGKNILDIGCGSGRLLTHLYDNYTSNFNYTGIDSSIEMLKQARKNFNEEFICIGMNDIKLSKKYDYIFLIASFHHLDSFEDRVLTLNNVRKLLNKNGKVFMTNWALNSELNSKKYLKCTIPNSINKFGSEDYNIKIGDYYRFYHSFNISELDYLFKEVGFTIIENKLFENNKNYISIIE